MELIEQLEALRINDSDFLESLLSNVIFIKVKMKCLTIA